MLRHENHITARHGAGGDVLQSNSNAQRVDVLVGLETYGSGDIGNSYSHMLVLTSRHGKATVLAPPPTWGTFFPMKVSRKLLAPQVATRSILYVGRLGHVYVYIFVATIFISQYVTWLYESKPLKKVERIHPNNRLL